MFAVVKTGGKQYRVAVGDQLRVEKLPGEAGDIVELNEVLMVGDQIGTPMLDGACVAVEILDQARHRKVIAFKKRRRQNSRRTIGHRQHFSLIEITEILTDGKKPSKKATGGTKKPAKAPKEDTKAEAKKEAPAKAAPKKEDAAAPAASGAPLFKAPAGDPDDLTKIKGIGPVAKGQLAEQGITQFAQVAALTDAEIVIIDEAMPFSAEQISDWRAQAKEMTKG
ncbi:50S ribosomal protein L21 [Pseudahrensia aquimaris]|uniref:Large ribosomal subunit protein bL21 n=1 Tax=Pseudahrensia aquimaris TaxID=744461 RepID=A0ABW3FF42_9HYPH